MLKISFITQTLREFTDALASKAPTPGGGGASALTGAVGIALASMVGNLTVGKKKYADVEDDVKLILQEADSIRAEMLLLIDRDAEVFEPIAKAYALPKGEERDQIMESCLIDACNVPLEIMKKACRAIELLGELGEKSNAAISDIGTGAVCCKAALQGASLNVYINTKSMTDRILAKSLENDATSMLDKYIPLADSILADVVTRLS